MEQTGNTISHTAQGNNSPYRSAASEGAPSACSPSVPGAEYFGVRVCSQILSRQMKERAASTQGRDSGVLTLNA